MYAIKTKQLKYIMIGNKKEIVSYFLIFYKHFIVQQTGMFRIDSISKVKLLLS